MISGIFSAYHSQEVNTLVNKKFLLGILLIGLVFGMAFAQTYNVEVMNNMPYPFLIKTVVLKDQSGAVKSTGEGRAFGFSNTKPSGHVDTIGKVTAASAFSGTIEVKYNANAFSDDKNINKDITDILNYLSNESENTCRKISFYEENNNTKHLYKNIGKNEMINIIYDKLKDINIRL